MIINEWQLAAIAIAALIVGILLERWWHNRKNPKTCCYCGALNVEAKDCKPECRGQEQLDRAQ